MLESTGASRLAVVTFRGPASCGQAHCRYANLSATNRQNENRSMHLPEISRGLRLFTSDGTGTMVSRAWRGELATGNLSGFDFPGVPTHLVALSS